PIAREPGDEVEREIEPLALLGIDGEADGGRLGVERERAEHWQQLGQDPLALRRLVARVEGRELDGDAGRLEDAPAGRRLAGRGDRRRVALEITPRIGSGARRLAQHVVGMAVALAFGGAGAL